MKKYKAIDTSEKQIEDMVRKAPNLIEEGLIYVDHQKRTEWGRLDVLFVDSGNAMVVAELKVVEDDGILLQGIDYYDYITNNVEGFARAYKDRKIDPTQKLRLFLIAPSFSVSLINRCKWIDIPLSLFTFQCIVFEDDPKEIVPIFKELTIPARQQPIEVYTIEQRLDYITDNKVRKTVEGFLKEIKQWDEKDILIEPIKYDISIKVSGGVFAYLGPRRKHFIVSTYDTDDEWKNVPVRSDGDLNDVRALLKSNYEKYK
ncbi:DUF91 domain-containing protein [bacterium]|nr:DUF91 domain-containing protein [bacterium]MCK4326363.1 DUF91 domain-containing protein [bacterium]